jgi:capsular exopolysaccharide synthesis family protein
MSGTAESQHRDGELELGASAGSAIFEALDPRELWRIVSAQRWLILAVTSLVVGAVAIWTFTSTPYYRAKVRVLIERTSSNTVAIQEIYQLGAASDDYYLTQYKLLESRAVGEAALAALPEADRAWFGAGKRDPIDTLIGLRQILPVQKSRLVDVVADHPDPAVAGRMAEAIVAAYIKNGLDRRHLVSSSAMQRLQADAESLREKLLAAERAVQEFKSKNEIVAMNDRQSLAAARLEKLNDELAETERSFNETHARLQAAQKAVSDAAFRADLPEALESPVVANCKRALLEAKSELSQLGQSYKPLHPRMLAVRSKIGALEAQLQVDVQSVYSGLVRQHERAQSRQADVERRIAEQKRALIDLEQRAIQYQILRDDADSTRKLHDTVLARFKEVEIIQGAETTNVHPIGGPEISARPVRPTKWLNLLLALLGGALLAGGLAFTIDICDRSIKSAADAVRWLDLPVLGLVPRLEGVRALRGPVDKETLDARSAISEAFRTIRTGLAFSEAGKDMRSMMVTSAAPEEGKSLVSINLAVAFARGGKRVLLVDADLRRPRLHRAFECHAEEGFSSLLIGAKPLAELVCASPIEGLSVLPCGVVPPNPVELLAGPGMRKSLDEMLAAFDMVVFDSPPAGVVSDACVIATVADRVLYVVRSFRTDRGHARRAVGQLETVGARLAGVILNHSDARAERYGRYDAEYAYAPRYELAGARER